MTNDLTVNLELSGLNLDRPMQLGGIWSARVVAVEGDFLIYELPGRVKRNNSQGLLRGLLDARSSREKTIQFCRKWGVLGLCAHGIPIGHGACTGPEPIGKRVLRGFPRYQFREPIDSVQKFASGLESLLRIGAEMTQGRSGHVNDWVHADDVISGPDFPPWKDDPAYLEALAHPSVARTNLQILIRRLIEICKIRPRFFWNEQTNSWQIDLDSDASTSNLPGLMVTELLISIADKDGLAICSSCHFSYIPERRPDPTRRNYCPTCRGSADARDASRAYRERKRNEQEKKHGQA
jgi:hypothetical protein